MKPQSTDIFDMVPFSPVTPLVPTPASNGCPPPPPTTLPPDISECLQHYLFARLSRKTHEECIHKVCKMAERWSCLWKGGWSLSGPTMTARSPDPLMVVVGKDLFGAEPFDPFTCGAADFPPDIQSKLDEMQVSPRLCASTSQAAHAAWLCDCWKLPSRLILMDL